MTDLREQLAELVHDVWIGWMQGVFCKGHAAGVWKRHNSGPAALIIGRDTADRWRRQIFTEYNDLDDVEKDIDRMIADKILKVIEQSGKKFCECGEKE